MFNIRIIASDSTEIPYLIQLKASCTMRPKNSAY